jgi:RimJ/RimL family protein N-acetyltransferase
MTHGDIEMVRRWRTSPEIAQFMLYREPITPEMQEQWYASLDPDRDLFFIIRYGGVPVGLSDMKRIDWEARTCVGGIFVVPEHWNSDIPLRATFCASDYSFFECGLDATLSTVRKDNRRAVRFNLSIGYHILNAADEAALTYEMRLDKIDYDRATKRLRDYLAKVSAGVQ